MVDWNYLLTCSIKVKLDDSNSKMGDDDGFALRKVKKEFLFGAPTLL